jgi:hypothetical protein
MPKYMIINYLRVLSIVNNFLILVYSSKLLLAGLKPINDKTKFFFNILFRNSGKVIFDFTSLKKEFSGYLYRIYNYTKNISVRQLDEKGDLE